MMTSKDLSKNLAMQLMELITKVNEKEVNPNSVNASCNAAKQIYNLVKLNFEIKKHEDLLKYKLEN